MNMHLKKMMAPITVTVVLILYYLFYFGFLISLVSGLVRILFGVFPLVFSALTVKVCIERIKEIKKGEEDDLSKY